MKKAVLFAAVAAVIGLASCSGNKQTEAKATVDEDQVYTGVLPAADAEGIRYTLTLDYDDDNVNKGDYDLLETYLQTDSVSSTGTKDGVTYKSEGDFSVVNRDGKKYLKLVKDVKDSDANASSDLYFEVDNDSTLTLVNADFERAVSDSLNYSLTRTR